MRHRKKKFAHLSLKHITLLGIVRMKKKEKKQRVSKRAEMTRSEPIRGRSAFLFDEAAVNENDAEEEEGDDDNDEDDEHYENGREDEENVVERGMSESEFDSDCDSENEVEDVNSKPEEENGDLAEMLVREEEDDDDDGSLLLDVRTDHAYSCVRDFNGAAAITWETENNIVQDMEPANWRKRAKYRYSFLYAVSASGVTKKIKNCIPKAVAILSNSKTIILNHVHVMLECLNPALAELCYMDTDSCLFSFTHLALEDNLLEEKKQLWAESNILADETGPESCHGKLKLEGVFRVGLFKALKIYRLFSTSDFEREQREKICYTRCKGVNRNIAKIIPNAIFAKETTDKTVVHRSCLRPSRTGEMLIAHECKSLAAPFNLKRFVTSDGLHSFPVSYVPASDNQDGGEGGEITQDYYDNGHA